MIALAQAWSDVHGPVDIIVAQTIALRTSFGPGDADLQLTGITCANRSSEAFALARREARITLGVEDVPVLCSATGASRFIPYGQAQFVRGELACASDVKDRLEQSMATARCEAQLCALTIGQGVSLDAEMAPITGTLG